MHRPLGWHDLNPLILQNLSERDKCVIIFPHTSRLDQPAFFLYMQDLSKIRRDIYVMMRQSPHNRFYKNIFKKFYNIIEVPHIKDRGRGVTQYVIDYLKSQQKFYLFMSPEGDRDRSPWRSGYYHIAKQLQASICVTGFDYAQHRIRTTIIFDWHKYVYPEQYTSQRAHQTDLSSVEPILQEAMGQIMPKYPEKSSIPVVAKGYPTIGDSASMVSGIILILAIIVIIIIIWKHRKN